VLERNRPSLRRWRACSTCLAKCAPPEREGEDVTRNAGELQRQLRVVRNLQSAAFHRHPKAWEWMFDVAASDADQATDLVRARALVKGGRVAIAKKDTPGLRSVVQDLWKLLPVSVQERRLGHDSGVR
jgi:molecular chaperone DnaK